MENNNKKKELVKDIDELKDKRAYLEQEQLMLKMEIAWKKEQK